MWREGITLLLELHGPIEVLSLSFWPIKVIFGVHDLKITLEVIMLLFSLKSVWRIRVHWLPSLPIIFYFGFIETVFFNSVCGGFDEIFELVGVLALATFLVEELLEVRVVAMVVFGVGDLCSVVPDGDVSAAWEINSFLKSIHFY